MTIIYVYKDNILYNYYICIVYTLYIYIYYCTHIIITGIDSGTTHHNAIPIGEGERKEEDVVGSRRNIRKWVKMGTEEGCVGVGEGECCHIGGTVLVTGNE